MSQYQYNDTNVDILVSPELWQESTEVLFLQRQLELLQNRKRMLPNDALNNNLANVINEGIVQLTYLIDKLYEKQSRGPNQFL
jgi:hypothetical protein